MRGAMSLGTPIVVVTPLGTVRIEPDPLGLLMPKTGWWGLRLIREGSIFVPTGVLGPRKVAEVL